MKKLFGFFIILFLFVSISINFVSAENSVSDIKNHWASYDITYLIEREVIDGYPDGTFRPNSTILIDAFLKMIVIGLGFTDIENGDSYWASNYIDKAIEINLIENNEFSKYKSYITRKQMAKVIVNALEYQGNISSEILSKEELYLYKSVFNDYLILDTEYDDFIALAYKNGIIGGYPDGSFKENQTATRAEASTMICRLLDKDRRLAVTVPVLSEFMFQYNKETGFDEFINNTKNTKYTNTDYFRFENGKYIMERDSSYVLYVDGYEFLNDHFNNLSKTIGDVMKVLYGDDFYIGAEYYNNEYRNGTNIILLKVTEAHLQYIADNFSFRFMFCETSPSYNNDLILDLTIIRLNHAYKDKENNVDYDIYIHGIADDLHRYKIIASMMKIFGDDLGLEIGEFVVNEYIKKHKYYETVNNGYENTQIFGDIKVRSYIPKTSYETKIEFSYIK